jgi:peptidoglycan/LPS O-acetylase OafA/YrhL
MVYLRGFAILSVIFVHVADNVHKLTAWLPKSQYIVFLLEGIAKGYPEFVFVSGLVLKMVWARCKKNIKTFYFHRLKSVMPAYLVFSVIYYVYAGRYHGQMPMELLGDFASSLWHSDTSNQLWFIFNLAQLYLMFPILYSLMDWAKRKGKTVGVLAIIFAFHMLWMGFTTVICFNQINADTMARRFILSSIFFFCMGIAGGLNAEKMKAYFRGLSMPLLIALLGLLGYVIAVIRLEGVGRAGHYYDMLAPYTTYFFLLRSIAHTLNILILSRAAYYVARTKSWLSAMLGSLGKYSFGIFLIHEIVRLELEKVLGYVAIDYNSKFFYPIMFIGTTLISWAIAYAVSRISLSQYIIGYTERRGIQDAVIKTNASLVGVNINRKAIGVDK